LWEVKSLNLGINKKHCLVKVVVEGKVPEQSRCSEVLGIDLGLRNFAALSNEQIMPSTEIGTVLTKVC